MDFLKNFPEYQFVPGRFFMWSPSRGIITYDIKRLSSNNGKIGLLHEIGHAYLNHTNQPKYDMQLLAMEMDAWDFVRRQAPAFKLKVDEAHIERCISSYDQWLSKRATCPDCNNFSLQRGRNDFSCFICGSSWEVNYRKDRRVKRTITSRWHTHLVSH